MSKAKAPPEDVGERGCSMLNDAERRSCKNCRAVLSLSCFYRTGKGYRRHLCWACHRQWERAYLTRPEVQARRALWNRQEWVRRQTRERMRRTRERQGGGR